MIINRKLNESEIKITEHRVGNIVCNRLQTEKFVVSGIDGFSKKTNLFKIKKGTIEISEIILDIKHIRGFQLWGDINNYDSQILKEILIASDFIVLNTCYYQKNIGICKFEIEDSFYSGNVATLLIYINEEIVCKHAFWYLHEFQNIIFEVTRIHIFENYQDIITQL